jgi:hypothetical protein
VTAAFLVEAYEAIEHRLRELVPAVMVFSSFIHAFACFSVAVFLENLGCDQREARSQSCG